MKLQTKYFGEIDFDESDAIRFQTGMLGFADEKEFALLPFAGYSNQMLCMQSIKTPELAFVLLDPFIFCPDYTPELQDDEIEEMGVENPTELYYYVLCAVRKPISTSTVNMRCPIAINPHTLEARQIIMEAGKYEMRQMFSTFKKKEEDN